jgi:branched-chain amino acid transport system ATP-binding protein
MTALFQVEGLTKSFGGLRVARDIALAMAAGDRIALIGPNGAGKTTFVNLVTGALGADAGTVKLAGHDISRDSMVSRVRRGLVRTFQITRLFLDVSVHDHVALAILQRERRTANMLGNIGRMADVNQEAGELLAALNLTAVAHRLVREIAYGQQRLLEIVLALALKPKVLLLDEPAAGVAKDDSPRIFEALGRLPPDLAVLMIDHDMDLVFRFASRIIVMANGAVIFEGAPAQVAADPKVREAYLGSYAQERR